MRNIVLPALSALIVFSCVKKPAPAPVAPPTPELEYRIINDGGTAAWVFELGVDVNYPGNYSYRNPNLDSRYFFPEVQPGDTFTVKLPLWRKTAVDLDSVTRRARLYVRFRDKVFSPFLYPLNFIIEGEPYAYGWTYRRSFRDPEWDTVRSEGRLIQEIHWPSDTLRLEEAF